jgi:transglycosylase-like protein with SLT domain/D-alanyl-D-alanine carboxypeptidase-like protein
MRPATDVRGERGQALLLLLGILLAVLVGAVVLGGIATGVLAHGGRQRAADLAALAAARAMRDVHHRVFAPPVLARRANPEHLSRAAYLALGRRIAATTAGRNGSERVAVSFPGGGLAPVRVRVTISDPLELGAGREVQLEATAEAELLPPGSTPLGGPAGSGEYSGPLAHRDGKPMRPDVASAYDRMAAAALRDGHRLTVTSGFRTDVEQARLFAAHPDPRWVARPGTSLHRLGTELDLGPPSAYGWLAANGPRFHFVLRYAWEPWHWGFALNAGTRSVGYGRAAGSGAAGAAAGASAGGLPGYVPARFAPALRRAAQRWSVSAALLSAQVRKESGFNPRARSPAGALGIAQFMPGTARAYGLRDPFDPDAAIDAQAHLMRDLLRVFGSVPLALAAYNAGPARVQACMCVPRIPETQAYVADILGLLSGGDAMLDAGGGLTVRLVR